MTRGTTPTYTFELKDHTVNLGNADSVYVTFRQGRRALRKSGTDVTVSGYTAVTSLTHAESLAFLATQEPVYAQLNWIYSDGSRSASEIVRVTVLDNLEPEVLS